MNRLISAASAAALALAVMFAAAPAAMAQNTSNYMKQGGAEWVIGGKLTILPGANVNFNGTSVTTVSGETALDGSNPTPVTTGLTTITACVTTIKTSTAPGLNTTTITYTTTAGALSLYGWKPTSISNPTLIASTGTDTVGWACFGS